MAKGVNLNSYSTKDLDAKFEKVTKEDMRLMTGTGMTPKKKKTTAKKKTTKKKG